MRKTSLLVLLFVSFAITFGVHSAIAEDLTKFKGQKITVTCWAGFYQEPFEEIFSKPFMKASGAIIVMAPGWSEFISKIKSSPEDKPPYDVFMADGWNYIAAMNLNRLMPIRKENIPNANNIYAELMKREAWVKGYGVPFDGGKLVPIYVRDKISFTPDSWKDLLRPELSGKLSLDQAFYYGLYAAAFICDKEPGAQEIYSKEGLDAVFQTAAELAPRVKKFYKAGAELFQLMDTGEVSMGVYYADGTYGQIKKGMNLGIVSPKEGAVAWIGYLTVLKGTKNRDLAEAFINWCLDPERQTRFSSAVGGWVSNKYSKVPPELKGIQPSSDEEFKRESFFDWNLLNEKWVELEERWKKEVLSKAR